MTGITSKTELKTAERVINRDGIICIEWEVYKTLQEMLKDFEMKVKKV